jgi:hypothetical protein
MDPDWNQTHLRIPVTSNQNWYMEDFLEFFTWFFMDHSKDNLRNKYLIFKHNYFISFLVITSFSY